MDRVDVAKGGGDWSNELLVNYALAVEALDKLDITDQRSWKYLGAMHGFDRDYWISEGVITAETEPPGSLTDGTFGDQCQHGTWYFLPWHRGYLFAFEAIIAATVKDLTGRDWALPYWNYLDANNPDARKIPPAFEATTMKNGRPNPFVRYQRQARGSLPNVPPQRDINLKAMEEDDFAVGQQGRLGYGGGRTGFTHFGGGSGQLEINPHNAVHGMLGGFMGDPYLAGLDPLFWLHHCNIDRLWEAWMSTDGKTLPEEQDWRDKPTSTGGRSFMMPGPKAGDPPIAYTASATLEGGPLHRSYDDLIAGTGVVPGGAVVGRVNMGSPEDQTVELLGSNEDVVELRSTPVKTDIPVEAEATGTVVAQMGATEPGETVARLYLDLESIRGAAPYATVDVYVNLPQDADAEKHPELIAGTLHLFGLNRASDPDGGHGGNGLGQALDITDLAGRLSAADDFDPSHLRVTLVPVDGSSDDAPITVDKVSVLKRTGIVTAK